MGVCASCNEVQKGKGDAPSGIHPEIPESDSDPDGSEADHSEVAASSDEEDGHDDYRQGVEEILKSTGKNLKRGKTMAMKEAISTAKKCGLQGEAISEAERQLTEHKKQQRREEVEKEVEAFFSSAGSQDIALTEKMVKKAQDADCREEVMKRLRERLEELVLTRKLEQEEEDLARSYLKESCRDLVLAATGGGGRQAVVVNLEDGRKQPVTLSIDPPLQHLFVVPDRSAASSIVTEVPLGTLKVCRAKDDKKLVKSKGFGELEDDDVECAMAVRFDGRDRSSAGLLCFVEPTPAKRDRLVEALLVLSVVCA